MRSTSCSGMLVHGLADGLADGVGHALGHLGKHGLSPWGGNVGVVHGGAVEIVLIIILVSHERGRSGARLVRGERDARLVACDATIERMDIGKGTLEAGASVGAA